MSITKIALTLIIAFAMIGMAAAEKPGQPDAVKWTPPGGYQTYDNVTDAPLGPLADLYDRDNDGTLDLREIQIVYHDWLHLRLTLEEETAFIAILGEEPRFVGSLGSTTKPVEVCEEVEVCEPLPDLGEIIYDPTKYNGRAFYRNYENAYSADIQMLGLFCSNLRVVIRNSDINSIYFDVGSHDNDVYLPCDATPNISGNEDDNSIIPYDNSIILCEK